MDDIAGTIITNQEIAPGCYLARLLLRKPIGITVPGQFVMIKIPDNSLFFRRPFSIYEAGGHDLSIVYKVVGRGTELLSRLPKKTEIMVLGPLGKGFIIRERRLHIVMAGGIGVAGVHGLIRSLGKKALVFYGCSEKKELGLIKSLRGENLYVATLDGSSGFKGNVVELLAKQWNSLCGEGDDAEIYACGPDGMLKALRDFLARASGVPGNGGKTPCQVLVEERMACGLGLCFGCVKETEDKEEPYKRVCKEGPAFSLWELSL